MNLYRWCVGRMARLLSSLREERAHNRHLTETNQRLTSQNDTLRLKLLDLGVDPNEVNED